MSATPIVTGTDFVCIPTRDHDAATKFYADVLGLEFAKQWGDRPGSEFETGNLTLAVMESENFGIDFQPINVPVALHVEDFDAAKAELESRGVEFEGDVLDSGVCYQAFFKDPDGNQLNIHHRYAPKDARPGD